MRGAARDAPPAIEVLTVNARRTSGARGQQGIGVDMNHSHSHTFVLVPVRVL